jgi:hypothetical protein
MVTLIRKSHVVLLTLLVALITMAAAPASAAQVTPIDDSIEPIGTLALTVYDASAPNIVPVADALVVVFDIEGNPVAKGNTDAKGQFSAELLAGMYTITVKADGYKYHYSKVILEAGVTTEAASMLEKEIPLGEVAILVYDNNGFAKWPIANAALDIFTTDGVVISGYTNEAGMFYASLEGGVYQVRVTVKGYKPYIFEIAVKPGLRVEYEAALDKEVALGMLTVFVFEREGSVTHRNPIPNAVVTVYDSTGTLIDKSVTDEYGMFTFELAPDTYYVEVGADGYRMAKALAEVKPSESSLVEVQIYKGLLRFR